MFIEWLGIPAGFLAWAFAFYIYLVATPSRATWLLIALLVADGLAVITSYDNHLYYLHIFEALGTPRPGPVIHQFSDWVLIAVYLPFIGATVNSRLVAPLKVKWVANTILFGGLIFALSLFWMPEDLLVQFRVPFYVVICLSLTWGFVGAVHAWKNTDSETERVKAKAFAIAFGVRDVTWIFTFLVLIAYRYGIVGDGIEAITSKSDPMGYVVQFLYQGVIFFCVPLIAYGILRTQLFDIDLRIKRRLKQGTVATIFFVMFFVVSELASNLLSEQLGTVAGVLAAGVLVFFLNPLFRVGEMLSNAAMPNTQATPAYESFRKMQVYDAAVRTALEDGPVSEQERRLLDSMIESLGIDRQTADRIESELLVGGNG